MHIDDYSAGDFALDPRFQEWVQKPDSENERFWQNWLAQHPEKQGLIAEARQLVLHLNFRENLPTPAEQAAVWNRINATRQQNHPDQTVVRPLWSSRQWVRWAAVLTGIAFLGSMLYFLNQRTTPEYHTAYGQTQTIILPDGSEVILNAHSNLKLATNWQDGKTREVWLTGEAFFKVVKKTVPTRFVVHTDNLNVEVLGTQFNVASRKGATQVVLNSGKVKLDVGKGTYQKSIVMVPGDLVEISGERKKLTKRSVKPERYNDWTNQQWILDNTSLSEVTARLEATFGLRVTFVDPDIAQERMTGVVPSENLDDLIDALSTTNGLKITRQENQLYISR
ncbi:FecR family protein [Spirosoma flavus]